MNCPKCETDNEENAKFCINCGAGFYGNLENKTIDILVFIAVSIWMVITFANFTIQKIVPNWYETPAKYFQMGTNFIYAVLPIVFAFSIRNKTLRIIALVCSALLSVNIIYSTLEWMLKGLG